MLFVAEGRYRTQMSRNSFSRGFREYHPVTGKHFPVGFLDLSAGCAETR